MRWLLLLLSVALGFTAQSADDEALSEKIGQMLLVGFTGLQVDESHHIVRDITDYHIGGVILFDKDLPNKSDIRNISSPNQVKDLVKQLQSYAEVPLFVAVDQEGGKIARLKTHYGFPPTLSAMRLGQKDDEALTAEEAEKMAAMLSKNGFNMDFFPVVDLNLNPVNPIIARYERSFGADPERVVKLAQIFIDKFNENNILCSLKHFPGHGSADADSHLGFVDVTDSWQEIELEPFARLIQAKSSCPLVMTAHLFNQKLDPKYPATLSANTIQGLLREQLDFKGIVITDDMQMQAIADNYSLEEAIKLAINAGNDILIFSNNSPAAPYNPDLVPKIVAIIKKLVADGEIPQERIDEAYQRIMQLKQQRLGANNDH